MAIETQPVATGTPASEAAAPVAATPTPAAPGSSPPPGAAPAVATPASALLAAPAQEVELKVADGFNVDAAALGEFKTIAKELGLDSSKAQKVFDVYAKAQQGAEAAYAKQVAGWEDAVKKDPEFGGEKFAENLAGYQKAVEWAGGAELTKILRESGMGSHPAVVKAFHKVAKAMANDSIRGTKADSVVLPGSTPEDRLRRAYTHPTSKELFKES